MRICIFGASSAALSEEYYAAAREFGKLLAARGHSLIFGGGAHGIMGAAAEGAKEAGGEIIGIAPKFFDEPGVLYDGCTKLIFTETMRQRKSMMDEMCDAVAVFPGGIGTYEEFFEILTLKQLGRIGKAIAVINTNGYYAPMEAMLRHTAAESFMAAGCMELYKTADTPRAAIDYIENYVPEVSGSIFRLEDYSK